MVEVCGEDNTYDIMRQHSEDFDFSNERECFSLANKRAPGKSNDETAGSPIIEFIGLRAKCYSIQQPGRVKNNVLLEQFSFIRKLSKGSRKP